MPAHHTFPFFDIDQLNDLAHPEKSWAIQTMIENAQPTLSFFVLLVGSTSICTLGLLQNNPSVIIGGMIISPLMWPLLLVGLGISSSRPKLIRKAMFLLAISVLLVLISASAIVLASPIKSLTSEILARAQPTFFDLIVALVAGAVAALAMLHKRISASLAGVAIATSLLPPLCVGAIGLTLGNMEIAKNGFLLFFASIIAIIFVAALLFSSFGLRNQYHSDSRIRNLLIVLALLVIIANPLVSLLKAQSFQVSLFPAVSDVLQSHFSADHPKAKLQNVVVDASTPGSAISVTAQVILPEKDDISYAEQQAIVAILEQKLHSPVNLSLTLQRSISLLSQSDANRKATEERLRSAFGETISKIDDLEIDAVSIDAVDSPTLHWSVSAVLRTNDLELFDQTLYVQVSQALSAVADEPVELRLELIPRKVILAVTPEPATQSGVVILEQ